MKVYALFHGAYSDRELWGIFDSLELAQAEHDRYSGERWRGEGAHPGEWEAYGEDSAQERRWGCKHSRTVQSWGCTFGIEERELRTALEPNI